MYKNMYENDTFISFTSFLRMFQDFDIKKEFSSLLNSKSISLIAVNPVSFFTNQIYSVDLNQNDQKNPKILLI